MNSHSVAPTDSHICPVCFSRYSSSQIQMERPTCPECDSEAIEIDVIPYNIFLLQTPLSELEKRLNHWKGVDGFRPEYQEQKLQKIEQTIADKKNAA